MTGKHQHHNTNRKNPHQQRSKRGRSSPATDTPSTKKNKNNSILSQNSFEVLSEQNTHSTPTTRELTPANLQHIATETNNKSSQKQTEKSFSPSITTDNSASQSTHKNTNKQQKHSNSKSNISFNACSFLDQYPDYTPGERREPRISLITRDTDKIEQLLHTMHSKIDTLTK